MIKRDYSVSVIKPNRDGGVQYRHFIITTTSLFKKSIHQIYSDIYVFLNGNKDYVIISLSRL